MKRMTPKVIAVAVVLNIAVAVWIATDTPLSKAGYLLGGAVFGSIVGGEEPVDVAQEQTNTREGTDG